MSPPNMTPHEATAPPQPPLPSAPPSSAVNWHPPPGGFTPFQLQSGVVGPWTSGLCDCFDDLCNCCVTCFCPCITFGQIAEIVDRGSSSCGACGVLYSLIMCLTGCACLYSCFYRTKLRKQYSLPGGSCGDCLVHCCCEHCALCQEYRELKNRGFDMHMGWQANMERQAVLGTVAPVAQEGMTR